MSSISPPPPRPAEPVVGINLRDDPEPCRECRRRKGKCDGRIPVCSPCMRYRRHCLYDKHSRTPLTRKHLTDVENRLENAIAILRNFVPETELAHLLEHGLPPNFTGTSAPPPTPALEAQSPQGVQSNLHPHQPVPPQDALTGINTPPFRFAWRTPSNAMGSSSPASLRTQDTEAEDSAALEADNAADEFEWDEQEQNVEDSSLRDIVSTMAGSNQEDIEKAVDGMASLAVDAANTGYLGSASPASLLRTLWLGSVDSSKDHDAIREARRRHLQQLLRGRVAAPSLPSVQSQFLSTKAAVDVFIDVFFNLYHVNFPILHEPTFRAEYAEQLRRPPGRTWLALANLVVALGAFICTPCSDDTDLTIFKMAKQHLSLDCLETGSILLVQILALAATYLQKVNKPNSGYNYGGLALRLAISLGLHKDIAFKDAPLKQETRRRVWWCLCILDVGATITYSRPLNWPQFGVDAALPSNVHEQDLLASSIELPLEVEDVKICTYLRVQSSYHMSTIPIYNRLITSPTPSVEELINMDEKHIESWRSTIPSYFRDDSRFPINARFALVHGINYSRWRNLRIIMYRRSLVRWARDHATMRDGDYSWHERLAVDRCLTAARETIQSISYLWSVNIHNRLSAFYCLYFLFQAALIPVHCLRCNVQSPLAVQWCAEVQTALETIRDMQLLNASSAKCYDVIMSLCGSLLPSSNHEDTPRTETGSNTTGDQAQGDAGAAVPWMSTTAPMIINPDIWLGSLDNNTGNGHFDDSGPNFMNQEFHP